LDGRFVCVVDSPMLVLVELFRDCELAAPNGVVWDLLIGNSHRFGDFPVGASDSPVLSVFNEELSLIWRRESECREDELSVVGM
jgi:hypothetical protein